MINPSQPEEAGTPRLLLIRVKLDQQGAFGILFDEAEYPFAVSLEHTFEDGKPLLPAGVYICSKSWYIKGGYDTFEIPLVGHDRILFHKANTEKDLRGCIGVGDEWADFSGQHGIADSTKGFGKFWSKYGKFDKIRLEIKEKF